MFLKLYSQSVLNSLFVLCKLMFSGCKITCAHTYKIYRGSLCEIDFERPQIMDSVLIHRSMIVYKKRQFQNKIKYTDHGHC